MPWPAVGLGGGSGFEGFDGLEGLAGLAGGVGTTASAGGGGGKLFWRCCWSCSMVGVLRERGSVSEAPRARGDTIARVARLLERGDNESLEVGGDERGDVAGECEAELEPESL